MEELKCIPLKSHAMSMSLATRHKNSAPQGFVLSVTIEAAFVRFVTTESLLSTGSNMYDNLKHKIRELAHLLAYEEEVDHRFSKHYDRKREHAYLLKKLYKLEKKA